MYQFVSEVTVGRLLISLLISAKTSNAIHSQRPDIVNWFEVAEDKLITLMPSPLHNYLFWTNPLKKEPRFSTKRHGKKNVLSTLWNNSELPNSS